MKHIVDCCIAHDKEMKKVVIVNGKAIFDIDTIRQTAGRQSTTWRGGDRYLPIRTESCTSVSHQRVRVFEERR